MKPTIYTIAEAANVSIATVSRVFNNNRNVSEKTRRRIREVADALGYCPSSVARNLAGKTTETLAIVLPHLSDPFFVELIRGVESISITSPYHLLIYTSRDLDVDDAFLQFLRSRVDGLILGTPSSSGEAIGMLHKQGIPFVLLGDTLSDAAFDIVRPDNQSGAYRMTKHLIEQHGIQDIAFMTGPSDQAHSRERLLGYKQALSEHHIPFRNERVVEGKFNEGSGFVCGRHLLQQSTRPRAIFAGNDRMAVGIMSAATGLGLSIPEDLAVVGFDDDPSAQYLHPALTTVNVRSFEQGVSAIQQLLLRMEDPALPRKETIMSTPLVLRHSCGCLPETMKSQSRK